MNVQKLLLPAAVLLFLLSCGEFPTSYNRIDYDRVRLIDFIYEPAEAAPGDSVMLTAIFAGKEFDSITWQAAFDIIQDPYGTDTALDIGPLSYITIQSNDFSPNTYTATIKFKIPDSVMYTTSFIQDEIVDSVVQMISGDIGDIGITITREMLVYMLEYYCDNAPVWDSLMNFEGLIQSGYDTSEALAIIHETDSTLLANDPFYEIYKAGVKENLPALVQLFSIKIRIFAQPIGGYEIRSNYVVRYNSKLTGLSGVPIYENTNPQVGFVGIYKVKGADLASFDTTIHDQEYELFQLFGPADSTDSITTIVIEKGYTYFFTASSSGLDSAISLDFAFQQKPANATETHFFMWYFQHDSSEIEGVDAYDFLKISNDNSPTIVITPPEDKRVKSFVLWVEVWDYFLNEMTRPMASSVKEVRGKFSYSEEF